MNQQQPIATRSALESLYNRQREEIERLERLIAVMGPLMPKGVITTPPTPAEEHFKQLWDEARERVAPLVREALDAERWGGKWR